jgi:hypothetical protein
MEMDNSWLGEVINIEDPQKIGRIKVRVYGKFDDLIEEHIPWAYPAGNFTAGSDTGGGFFSVPKLGSIVSVTFDNDNIYHPEYHYNQRISNELKDELENDYEAAQSLIYDTEELLKLFYVRGKGLRIELKESLINLLNEDEGIDITTQGTHNTFSMKKFEVKTDDILETISKKKTVNTAPEIYLGGAMATEPLLFGNKTDFWLNELLTLYSQLLTLISTHNHSLGSATTTPPLSAASFTGQTATIESLKARIETLKSVRNFTL